MDDLFDDPDNIDDILMPLAVPTSATHTCNLVIVTQVHVLTITTVCAPWHRSLKNHDKKKY